MVASSRFAFTAKELLELFRQAIRILPQRYKEVGQPVLVPGDMGRCSFIAVGTEKAMAETFGSTCHGAGRMLSRGAAKRV